ncbi:disease resistance protein RPM1 [Prunus yedoensis var. nudiflora]|uniref:Disease resistance protein RPM1 n=1 Tax=Prunus yedoensis var. nudiflora TaxID=2094558 RepID=A0A314YBG1_PRUYE|nr:disease resistance protein RPM1 [Prunus yedoensis var. nudiflora]
MDLLGCSATASQVTWICSQCLDAIQFQTCNPIRKGCAPVWRSSRRSFVSERRIGKDEGLPKDRGRTEESDEELKVWVKQLRDISHETEDILDEYTLLRGHDHDHGRGIFGSLCRLGCCIKNAKAFYRIGSELQAINSRIKEICEVHKRLRHKFRKAEQGPGSDDSAGNTWQDCRGDALLLDKSDLVGLDEPKNQLVGWLFNGSSGREVVSLAGMGGMGKTTLAKQVYDDPEVKKHFEVRAWITVNRSFKFGDLLKDMVQQLLKQSEDEFHKSWQT